MLFSIYPVRRIVPGDEDENLNLDRAYKVDGGRKDSRWRKQPM